MAPTNNGSPTWLDSLRKILHLEESRGFDNRAVVGGLDKYLQRWSKAMSSYLNDPALVHQLTEPFYELMSPGQRRHWANNWWEVLDDSARVSEANLSKGDSLATTQGREFTILTPVSNTVPRNTKSRRPSPELTVDSQVEHLRGVDNKTARRLMRLEVQTIRDLLYFFPRRHIDYSIFSKISELNPGEERTVVADVWDAQQLTGGPQGRRKDTEAVLSDETGNIRVIWFGQRYLARTLKPNTRIAVSGKPDLYRGQLVLESPEYEVLDPKHPPIHTGRLVPVYPLTEGLTGRTLRRITWQGLRECLGGVNELLCKDILSRTGLIPLKKAILQAHYPMDMGQWEAARRRLAFDELLTLQLAVLSRRQYHIQDVYGVPIAPKMCVVDNFLSSLPFPLTRAQKRCIEEIERDMEQGTPPMNRLLQGEVGSGKTVVALAALLKVAAAGFQGAVMAPTEVLAEQHFQTVSNLLQGDALPLESDHLASIYLESFGRPVSVGLLTSSTRRSSKRELNEMAANGTLDLLIGTQALIQESVSMPNLALAVVDEQHRFGVLQRSALRQRGSESPHTLIMSATPIPRTLTLTLYGDLDISTLDEMPAGRQKVSTRWLPPERREAAYGFIHKQIQQGRQAFVICPLVGESDTIEAKAATDEHQRLSEEIFPKLKLGLLHGRMSSKEKERVMRRFRDGDVDILVSTAVVEVGIDIGNATVMMIEGADRFGLAQLHQFRGRVGRGKDKSYCILMSDAPSEVAKERLSALEEIHDGFRLAEVDLEMRGPGDFFGTRQSGLPNLRMAQLSDRQLLESARDEASRLMEQDPKLKNGKHAELASQVSRLLNSVSDETS